MCEEIGIQWRTSHVAALEELTIWWGGHSPVNKELHCLNSRTEEQMGSSWVSGKVTKHREAPWAGSES